MRLRAVTVVVLALVATVAAAPAREAPLTVLVAASVSDGALGAIAPQTWTKDLSAALARFRVVTAATPVAPPTLADCRKVPADFLLSASFELRPQLPGLASGSGRLAGQARLLVLDCATGAVAGDQLLAFESDPVDAAPGDDPVPDSRWQREIPAAFAKHPLDLQRPAHVVLVQPPLARVGFRGATLHPGDVLRDVATAKDDLRERPIDLTVTQVFAEGVEVLFDTAGDRPELGDYVEPDLDR